MAEDKRITAQKLVAEFKARGAQATRTNTCAKDGIWLNLCRNKVADGLQDRILNPILIAQNHTNVCGMAAFVHDWAKDDPIGYAWLGISLYENGCGYIGRGKFHGKEVRPSNELKNSPIPYSDLGNGRGLEMNHADWIVLASVREAFNSVFNYSADEGIFAIKAWNYPSEVVAAFKAAGYTNIVNETDWALGKGWDNLKQASQKFLDKWRVVLLINMRMLDDKKMDTEALLVRTSDHWVGLQSGINITFFGSDYRVSPFKVFTWGKEKRVPAELPDVPLSALLKNYYGYIAAKY